MNIFTNRRRRSVHQLQSYDSVCVCGGGGQTAHLSCHTRLVSTISESDASGSLLSVEMSEAPVRHGVSKVDSLSMQACVQYKHISLRATGNALFAIQCLQRFIAILQRRICDLDSSIGLQSRHIGLLHQQTHSFLHQHSVIQ